MPANLSRALGASKGKTSLYRVGDWTWNFDAKPFDGHGALPSRIKPTSDMHACANTIGP